MAALVAALCASASRSSTSSESRHAWQQQYRRPAEIPFPKSNPYSDAKFKLGRALFFDPILSGSEVRSCATCHNPGLSWADGQPRAIGEKQVPLPLRSPTLLNIAWIPKLGWDGHFRNLEEVAMGPITATGNMNLSEKALVERLSAIPGYVDAFDAAFGEGEVTGRKLEFALATFERTIVSKDFSLRPLDRRRRKRDQRSGQARLRPVQRQSQLRGLPQRLDLHRRLVPRHRQRPRRRLGPWPAVPDVGGATLCLQDPDITRRGPPGSLHARRLGADIGRRARPL